MNITRGAGHAMGASRRRLEIDRVLGFDDFPLGAGALGHMTWVLPQVSCSVLARTIKNPLPQQV
jgi:hypothetical protein